MKIKINLTNYTIDYITAVPFIQGTDIRNKIEVLVPQNTITNIMVAYTLTNGRTTIALAYDGELGTETYNSVTYDKATINLPAIATRVDGTITATIIVTTSAGKYKFNVLNKVLNSTDFESFEDALDDAARLYATAMENLSAANTQQDQRLTALENADNATATEIGIINNQVFGNSDGTDANTGLKYIVRTDHEGRLDTLEDLNISSRLTALESDDIGFIALESSSTSGTLSDTDFAKVTKHDCIIYFNGQLYLKNHYNAAQTKLYFLHLEIESASNNQKVFTQKLIEVTLSTKAWSLTTTTFNALTIGSIYNGLDSNSTAYALSAAKGKYLNDELETLKTYIYQGNANTAIDRLKEIFDFLAGNDDDETLLNLLSQKADKSTTYTKTETDTLLGTKANQSTTYTKTETDSLLNDKSDKSTTYTKTESDTLLGEKANASNVYAKSETYTKTEVNSIIDGLVVDGYEMPYNRMLAIFNDAYSSDPVVIALNSLNGEVV